MKISMQRNLLLGLVASWLVVINIFPSYAQVFRKYEPANMQLGEVLCVAVDQDDMKWVGTNTLFYKFTGDSLPQAWQPYSNPHTTDTLLRHITAIAVDRSGNKWVGSYHNGVSLIQLNREGQYVRHYEMPNFQNKNHYIMGIAIDQQGKKWVATKESGVWMLDDKGKWYNYDISTVYEIPSNHIYAIAVDSEDVKWVGTDKGLCSTKDGTVWDLYDMNGWVTAITTDQKNNVCLCMEKRSKPMVYCNNEVHKVKGKDEFTVVKDLLIDRKGVIWAAGHGLARYETEDRVIYEPKNSNFKSRQATCLALDKDDMLWIGTFDDGLYKLDPRPVEQPKPEPMPEKIILTASPQRKKTIPVPAKKVAAPNLTVKTPAPYKVPEELLAAKPVERPDFEEAVTPVVTKVEPKADENKVAVIQGQEIKKGATIQLKGIFFKTNSEELMSYDGVNQLLKFMLENPTATIELSGHTDRNPDTNHPDYDKISQQFLDLSQRRVDAVALFLVAGGVKQDRIVTKAYGGSKPLVASFSTEKNRRVEMRILSW
jgi:outer membrane protein OmpA-like peptidoglycan-associated protein